MYSADLIEDRIEAIAGGADEKEDELLKEGLNASVPQSPVLGKEEAVVSKAT